MGTKAERKEKVFSAFRAMKDIGIHEDKTKQVLKKLLKLYDKNWGIIEAENYRVLADAIFDDDDNPQVSTSMDAREAMEDEAEPQDEPERPLKRLRLKNQDGILNPDSGETSSKKPKFEHGGGSEPHDQPIQDAGRSLGSNVGSARADLLLASPTPLFRDKGKQPVSSHIAVKDKVQPQTAPTPYKVMNGRTPGALQIKEPRVEQAVSSASKVKTPSSNALIKPKDEPFTDDMPPYETPLVVVHPEPPGEGRTLNGNGSIQDHYGGTQRSKSANLADNCGGLTAFSGEKQRYSNISNVPTDSPTILEISASKKGEVKLCLSCNFVPERPNFHAPSLEIFMKRMQEKCLQSYKIIDPSFSVEKLMRDLCESFLELGTNATDGCQVEPSSSEPLVDNELMRSAPKNATSPYDNGGTCFTIACPLDGSFNCESSDSVAAAQLLNASLPISKSLTHQDKDVVDIAFGQVESSSLMHTDVNSIVAVPQSQLNPDDIRCLHDVNDITRGEEKVKVPLLLDSNTESLPSFYYIPQNVVSQEADVNICLSQIGEKDCCPTCCGDCLQLGTPCPCTFRNGGEFAYTSFAVLKDEYLNECIALMHNPQKQDLLFCEECPLDRFKSEDMSEPCKGHLGRKFIKECWSRCGCNKNCVNRVVQRGVTLKLQVFLTSEGKGWGLRTLQDLPKGAFVCEFVGEILTIRELQKRNSRKSGVRHSYAMLLDADWGSRLIKDEQALCLDASSYGNVARFINHRCYDANLIQIPVEVDSTNHLYYRVAFFAARNVEALEELTWDYGVDFDDTIHYFKAFNCLCGSNFCRNMKRSNRSRSALVSR